MAALSTTARNAIVQAIIDLVDAQSPTAGNILIQDAGSTQLAEFTLKDPSYGAPSSGSADIDTPDDVTADDTGTASKAQLRDGNDTVVWADMTVGTSGAQVNLSTLSVTSGATLSVTSGTLSVAAA